MNPFWIIALQCWFLRFYFVCSLCLKTIGATCKFLCAHKICKLATFTTGGHYRHTCASCYLSLLLCFESILNKIRIVCRQHDYHTLKCLIIQLYGSHEEIVWKMKRKMTDTGRRTATTNDGQPRRTAAMGWHNLTWLLINMLSLKLSIHIQRQNRLLTNWKRSCISQVRNFDSKSKLASFLKYMSELHYVKIYWNYRHCIYFYRFWSYRSISLLVNIWLLPIQRKRHKHCVYIFYVIS